MNQIDTPMVDAACSIRYQTPYAQTDAVVDIARRLERDLAKANADKAGLIKALDETITMLEMRIEIDSDKDFETANDQIAALLKFSGGTRSAWAETAPRVILSARTALSQVQA